jgi:hypothetical protein
VRLLRRSRRSPFYAATKLSRSNYSDCFHACLVPDCNWYSPLFEIFEDVRIHNSSKPSGRRHERARLQTVQQTGSRSRAPIEALHKMPERQLLLPRLPKSSLAQPQESMSCQSCRKRPEPQQPHKGEDSEGSKAYQRSATVSEYSPLTQHHTPFNQTPLLLTTTPPLFPAHAPPTLSTARTK